MHNFLSHINYFRNEAEFTTDIKEEAQKPFLDILVKRTQHGRFTSVYGRPTHTDLYVNVNHITILELRQASSSV